MRPDRTTGVVSVVEPATAFPIFDRKTYAKRLPGGSPEGAYVLADADKIRGDHPRSGTRPGEVRLLAIGPHEKLKARRNRVARGSQHAVRGSF